MPPGSDDAAAAVAVDISKVDPSCGVPIAGVGGVVVAAGSWNQQPGVCRREHQPRFPSPLHCWDVISHDPPPPKKEYIRRICSITLFHKCTHKNNGGKGRGTRREGMCVANQPTSSKRQ